MSDRYDRSRWDEDDEGDAAVGRGGDETPAAVAADDIERSSENVLEDWPEPVEEMPSVEDVLPAPPEQEPPAELPASEPARAAAPRIRAR